jgi:beta-glucosidase/6-phospho-beta-glucosidase/beta-galactosidase
MSIGTDGWHRDGRIHFALGVEDTFVPQERPGERAIDEYALTGHYEHWHDDLALARDAGAELLRWGVPWYRVNPEPGHWDWSWLDRVVDRFTDLGLRPIVDLMHYGTPLWLDRQFAHPDYPVRVADYTAQVVERYADRIPDYTPVNEPIIHALFSGDYAYWPPYLAGDEGFVTLVRQLARGFVLSQQRAASILGDRATFVHVDAGMRFSGDVDAPEHREQAARLSEQVWLVEDLVTGRVDATHPLVGWLARHGMGDGDLAWFAADPVHPDVVGVNYYPRHSTELFQAGVHHRGGFADPRPTRDDGAAGLEELLRTAAARFGAPVMLTETAVTGTVDERMRWLSESVACVRGLRDSGVDVVGYTWWPVFDMYEWTYRHTTAPRSDHLLTMGLWSLVEQDGRLDRVPTPLVARFRELAT